MASTLSTQTAVTGSHPVFVGHSGFIAALAGCGFDIQAAVAGGSGKPDRPAADLAARAGLGGGLCEVFVPPVELPAYRRTDTGFEVDYPPPLDRHHALDHTLAGIAAVLRLQREPGSRVRLVRTIAELEAAQACGAFAAVLHLADADAIDPALTALPVLHAAGVRSLAITWSRPNAFGYGAPYRCPGTPDVGPGLTRAGIDLVHACNELGIMIDLAHLNDAGFRDVARHSNAPLVVSHGAAHVLAPSSRGTTDRQLDAIAASGGLVGVSLEGVDTPPARRVDEMVRHIEYLLERLGPEGVALGSDLYIKPGPQHPQGTSMLPDLLAALANAGHDAGTLAAICHLNWMRIFSATWRQESCQTSRSMAPDAGGSGVRRRDPPSQPRNSCIIDA